MKWRVAELVVSVSGDKRGGLGFLPLHMPTSQEMLPRASVEGARVGATGRNPMDPAQPAALSPLEEGKGRGEGRREQRNEFPTDPLLES